MSFYKSFKEASKAQNMKASKVEKAFRELFKKLNCFL